MIVRTPKVALYSSINSSGASFVCHFDIKWRQFLNAKVAKPAGAPLMCRPADPLWHCCIEWRSVVKLAAFRRVPQPCPISKATVSRPT